MHAFKPQAIVERERIELHRRLGLAVLALLTVVAGGTVAFVWIEGWSVWKGLYFTLITITTVGYGDEGISEVGRRFALILLVGGILVSSYTFALVVQAMVLRPETWRRRMQKQIDALSSHVIVAGFGRMGSIVCEELSQAGTPFVVVEHYEPSVERARNCGYLAIEGKASEDEVLIRAGVERASHVVSGVDSEAENIVITLTARELSPNVRIVARAERPEEVRKLKRAGADRIVSPFHSGGLEVANMILRPNVSELLQHVHGRDAAFTLAEFKLPSESKLVGRSIGDCGHGDIPHVAVVALAREGTGFQTPPPHNASFAPDDLVIVAGNPADVSALERFAQRQATIDIEAP